MKEIEVKILEIDVARTEKKLTELGAKKVFDGEIEWLAFDSADKSFSKQDILVRLRKKGEQVELAVKKYISREEAKISEETEILVSDFEIMKQILFVLGLLPKKGYPLRKHRVSYELDNVHFEFDTFPEFPTYLEIEGPDVETIKRYAKLLGFKDTEIKPWGVREVFKHYRRAVV